MLDITDPTIFVDTNTAIRQLIERGQLVPKNVELKIELQDELEPRINGCGLCFYKLLSIKLWYKNNE